jgi:hypothetical protein
MDINLRPLRLVEKEGEDIKWMMRAAGMPAATVAPEVVPLEEELSSTPAPAEALAIQTPGNTHE